MEHINAFALTCENVQFSPNSIYNVTVSAVPKKVHRFGVYWYRRVILGRKLLKKKKKTADVWTAPPRFIVISSPHVSLQRKELGVIDNTYNFFLLFFFNTEIVKLPDTFSATFK